MSKNKNSESKKNFEISTQQKFLSEEQIIKALNMKSKEDKKNHLLKYAYILHDKDKNKDGTLKEAHWHILIKMDNAYNFDYIAKRFGVPVSQVEKIRTTFPRALCYLTHNTDEAKLENKFQYEDTEVKSNYYWKQDAKKELQKANRTSRKEEIIESICNGTIKKYNIGKFVSAIENDKYSKSIDNAFKYREDILLSNTNRDMKCIFIKGDSGFGKTSFAKVWCKKQGLDFFVSSGSNDPLDGYKGQPAIILDDLRPSTYNLSDLLKLLDNNTATSVKSRYRNKVLETEYIIITTVLDIDTFFKKVFSEEKETIVQLKRRCGYYMEVAKDEIVIYNYDNDKRDYEYNCKITNPIPEYIKKNIVKEEESNDLISKFSLTEEDIEKFLFS